MKLGIRARVGAIVGVAAVGLIVVTAVAGTAARSEGYSARKNALRTLVESAASSARAALESEQAGTATRAEAQARAAAVIATLRTEDGSYLWINDMTPTMVMHPVKSELDGQFLGDDQDPNGRFLFRDMVAVVERDGKGFVTYDWPRPGGDTPIPKLSYVTGVPEWGWVIGSGAYVDDIDGAVRNELTRLLAWAAGAIAVLIVMAVLLVRRITSQLDRTAEVLVAVADGDLRPRVVPGAVPELAAMAESLNSTLDRTAHAVSSIAEHAGELAGASVHLAADSTRALASAEVTSQHAAHVASVVSELSGLVEDIAVTTGELTEAAADIARTAADTADVAQQASALTAAAGDRVKDLYEQTSQIRSASGAIGEIAEQTNLLALNATMEAARAGAQGAGFSVVAREVKALAAEAADTAHVIAERIDAVEREVESMRKSIDGLGEFVDGVSTRAGVIATAVHQQTAATEGIERRVHEVNQGAARIAASIQEVTDSAVVAAAVAGETLSSVQLVARIADQVNDLTSQFGLPDDA